MSARMVCILEVTGQGRRALGKSDEVFCLITIKGIGFNNKPFCDRLFTLRRAA